MNFKKRPWWGALMRHCEGVNADFGRDPDRATKAEAVMRRMDDDESTAFNSDDLSAQEYNELFDRITERMT